jgi:2-polyprenyl-3-methyl-5-hydroxy-6-metoxy-1,4-benzoquinol methylase
LTPKPSPIAGFEIAVDAYTACNETRSAGRDVVAFETSPVQWSYALQFRLPERRPQPCVIEVTLAVQAGRIGIGCVDDSMSRYVTGEIFVDAGEGSVTRAILVEDGSARFLIVRNAVDGVASSAMLQRIRIVPAADYSAVDIKRMRAARHQYWHYSFDLGDGVIVRETLRGGMATHRLNQRILMGLLDSNFDLSGHQACLDAACSSGFHSFALAERGLSVTAIDIDGPSIDQALFVQSCLSGTAAKSVQFRRQDVLAFEPGAPFDIVFCSGLFYHLRDLVGGAAKLFELSRAGGVVHSCVSALPGDVMELADHRKFYCCFPGEFSFVPTATLLEKIFVYAGFTDVRRYAASELCAESDLLALEPIYADLMRNHTAYYVVRK